MPESISMATDSDWMMMAFELAEQGRGRVHPNPLVGAVIVRDGRLLAGGFHAAFGLPHAEAAAIAAVADPAGCRGADLYVTLEPCCHHGKTPPCTEAIAGAGIGRVVFAVADPNPAVAGKGAAALKSAGIRVASGLEAARARRQNRAYFRYRETGLPFVSWKLALTSDGRSFLEPGKRARITGPEADADVDRLRCRADAVAIGVATAIADDPGLRVRSFQGRDPWRIIFDTRLRLPIASRLVQENADGRTIVVTAEKSVAKRRPFHEKRVQFVDAPAAEGRIDLDAGFRAIAERGILEILLEAGETLGGEMIARRLVQEKIIYQPSTDPAPALRTSTFAEFLGRDTKTVISLEGPSEAA